MKLNRVLVLLFSLLVLALTISCGSEDKPKTAAAAKPAEKKEVALYTARPCLERMSYMALRWQPDALPFHVISTPNTEDNGQDGKSSVWQASFASPNTRLTKVFTCSGSLLRDSPPYGVTSNKEFTSGANRTFSLNDVAVDSDVAAKLAGEHGGADLAKKNPQQPVYYELGIDPKSNKLLWAAVFGTSAKDSAGIGLIDAGTPKFIGAFKH